MKEVSCRSLDAFFTKLQKRHLPAELLAKNTPYTVAHLRNKHERIEWAAFRTILSNAHEIWDDEGLVELGGAFVKSPLIRSLAIFARLFFSAGDLYRWVNARQKGGGNLLFTCVNGETRESGPNRMRITLTMSEGYAASREFFLVSLGGLIALPRLLGLRAAEVQMHVEGARAVYEVTYPPGGGAIAWVRKVFAWPFAIRTAVWELKEANEVLQSRYTELQAARRTLAVQATQLDVANTISQLIHVELDVERTVGAIAGALVQVGGFVCAEVRVSTVLDDRPLEVSAREGAARGDAITAEFLSHGHTIGEVRAWPNPAHDVRERRELLQVVLPTLSMALDNAISYRELSDYREALEHKVELRTAELVQARDTLAQTVRGLEAAQQVRDRIFANINHEIRTPLTLVHLAVTDLKQRQGATLDRRSLQELDGIESSTRRLLRLVDDLLLLAAGNEGQLKLRVIAVDLSRLCELTVAAWRVSAEQKNIQIGFQCPPRCVRNVDEEKIERVLTNLISNAIKFTPSGGSVQVDLTESVRGVEIAVRDTGIGIDDDLRKRLFGRFEQGRPALHPGSRGSGIGLSIVKELTEAHGGEVSVESPRGGGSVFRVLLPAGARPRVLATGDDSHSQPLRLQPADFDSGRSATPLPRVLEPDGPARATVLVADDDPLLVEAIGQLLASEYRVVLAGDGLTALRMAQQHPPDILVSDVGMPGMDGLELTRRFRELPGNRLAPVVLLTALANLSDRLQGFDAGAVDYVAKPFEPAELMARIRSLLELRALALRLHQSEKLAALGTLSAGLAHEMRNPANAIVNAIEPLSELLPAELRQQEHPVAQLVGVLRECAQQIAVLSRQLLGFRREGDLEYQHTTVADVVGRAQTLTSPLFKSVTLRQELEYKGALDCAAPLLTQVLTNLLENGAQAAGAGGWVKLSSRAAGERLMLEVSDSGAGVPVELSERIFEPFFTTKPPGSGTGLGLTMSREIVERHGGSLDVREIADGTLFHIELPLTAGRAQTQRQRGGGR